MCGICGKLVYGSYNSIPHPVITQMLDTLSHRGPDDEGIYNKNFPELSIALGHKRLSIIDLSQAGHQPMKNENATIWITFNGEIYNFQELRKDLIAKRHNFSSNTDTEVILHLYEEYGTDCLNFLRGMFAFALWDENTETLFLARDRIGKKPLYYYWDEDKTFIFASEIKAIIKNSECNPEPDYESLHHYLSFQYVPSPHSGFKNIKKLSPAHYLILKNKNLKIVKYWHLDYSKKINLKEDEICQLLREELKTAVKLRLISDVPIGIFLSGGIDSSIVTAVASEHVSKPLETFTIGFKEKTYDETQYAKIISQKFNTNHHEFIVEPDIINILPKIIYYYNEPYSDSSAIPTFYLAENTKNYVKVVLNGDGGDESFGGYERYFANKIIQYFRMLPKSIKKFPLNVFSLLPESTENKNLIKRTKRFIQALNLPEGHQYFKWLLHFDENEKRKLYTEDFLKIVEGINSYDLFFKIYNSQSCNDIVDKTIATDIQTYLSDDLLVKMDRATMANSIEARSPLLDQKIVEFSATIPSTYKIRFNQLKYILKKAYWDVIPQQILRRGKMGFGVPIGKWFRSSLKDFVKSVLLDKKTLERGYFKPTEIENLIENHQNGFQDNGYKLWSLIILELWHREFIDKKE